MREKGRGPRLGVLEAPLEVDEEGVLALRHDVLLALHVLHEALVDNLPAGAGAE